MTPIVSLIVILGLFACREPAASREASGNPSKGRGNAADAGVRTGAQGSSGTLDRVESVNPSRDDIVPPSQAATPWDEGSSPSRDDDEPVPPTQVTGTFLVARTLSTLPTQTIIGVAALRETTRLSRVPERYVLRWDLAGFLSGVKTSLRTPGLSDYDVEIVVESKDGEAIKRQLAALQLFLTVNDRQTATDALASSYALPTVLAETAARDLSRLPPESSPDDVPTLFSRHP